MDAVVREKKSEVRGQEEQEKRAEIRGQMSPDSG